MLNWIRVRIIWIMLADVIKLILWRRCGPQFPEVFVIRHQKIQKAWDITYMYLSIKMLLLIKNSVNYELGWYCVKKWSPKGFSEELITYQTSSYPDKVLKTDVFLLKVTFENGSSFRIINITVFFMLTIMQPSIDKRVR